MHLLENIEQTSRTDMEIDSLENAMPELAN